MTHKLWYLAYDYHCTFIYINLNFFSVTEKNVSYNNMCNAVVLISLIK